MEKTAKKLKELLKLDKKIEKLPEHSSIEKQVLENEQRFESVYYSNKLEGNKLSKDEARRAVME